MVFDILEKYFRGKMPTVFTEMPNPKPWRADKPTAGLTRIDASALWRVSTRDELVTLWREVLKTVYKFAIYAILCGIVGIYTLFLALTEASSIMGVISVLLFVFATYWWTRAEGYYTAWADYEDDPVQLIAHSAYMNNGGEAMY